MKMFKARPIRARHRGTAAVPHIILFIACFLAVAPLVWSFFGSFKPFKELISSKDVLPHVWTTAHYEEIINRAHFFDAFKNSVVVSTLITVACLFTSSSLGYIFAKYRFRGKNLLFGLMVSTLFVPFVVLLVPLYITMGKLGLVNDIGGVILVGLWTSLRIFLT